MSLWLWYLVWKRVGRVSGVTVAAHLNKQKNKQWPGQNIHASPQTLQIVFIHLQVRHKLGRQWSGSVSWVPSVWLGPGLHHPLSQWIKAGLGLVRTNVHIRWNPFYKAFHEFVFVQTNEVVRNNSSVILTWQTCGQRSSRVLGKQTPSVSILFCVRIWFMFLISICKGESDRGLCMASGLAKRMRLHLDAANLRLALGHSCERQTPSTRMLFSTTNLLCVPNIEM